MGRTALAIIRRLLWDDVNTEHIAEHGVTPDEVEDVCFGRPLLRRSRGGLFLAFGMTADGVYLLVVLRMLGVTVARCITARPMTVRERRMYNRWRGV